LTEQQALDALDLVRSILNPPSDVSINQADAPAVEVPESEPVVVEPDAIIGPPASADKIRKLRAHFTASGYNEERRLTYASEVLGEPVTDLKVLTTEQANKVIQRLVADAPQ
jgi:hypothetical protein